MLPSAWPPPRGPRAPPGPSAGKGTHTWKGCRWTWTLGSPGPLPPPHRDPRGCGLLLSTPLPPRVPLWRAKTQLNPLDNLHPTTSAQSQPTTPRKPQTRTLSSPGTAHNFTHPQPGAHSQQTCNPRLPASARGFPVPTPLPGRSAPTHGPFTKAPGHPATPQGPGHILHTGPGYLPWETETDPAPVPRPHRHPKACAPTHHPGG